MADDNDDYKVGPDRPPLHTRFRKGQSGNPAAAAKSSCMRCWSVAAWEATGERRR